jgi:type II restriction/modification system DNA methylase subunit YeeA
METERAKRLAGFVSWVGANIKGDEKGEAQVFLDRFFQAFGHAGLKEAGATLEERIKKGDGKGTSFADLVWKPVVLIEMKKRGEDLARHYRQAFDYWTRLVPGRPRYVMLCNFDEFWVFDFDTQMDVPVDKVKVQDLTTRWGALGFLFPTPLKPIFGNDQVAVTRKAADQLADCFNKMVQPGRPGSAVDNPTAQRFILQMLVALFAEDIDMLPRYMVDRLLADCKTKQDSRDLIGGLFEAMNTREKTEDDRYQGVAYFNGGLFAEPARVELRLDELDLLRAASKEDWSKVRPEIFGTLFQHSLGKGERRAFGAHFTHPTDIMKIVGPTIVEPWRKLIEEADTLKRLHQLWQRMHDFIVLDPACGSGNFLYIAYRELKRLEARLFERMAEKSGRLDPAQMMFGFVTARQFFGIDINPFAVELAKVTMMIARKLAIDELHITEKALPLDNLDDNFTAADALIDELGNPVRWPPADVTIGNPPFLGAKRLKPERGSDYVNAVRRAYPEVPGMADYCVYWFRKSHDLLRPCTPEDPVAGRAGLVGTQNVRNNQSRVGGLEYIVETGTIVEAIDNQPWSGEANVHVSIVNWIKTQDTALLPSKRKLWFKVQSHSDERRSKHGSSDKEYELSYRECDLINSSISDKTDISAANVLHCNQQPQRAFVGVMPGYIGFVLSSQERGKILSRDGRSGQVIHPYLIGNELLPARPRGRNQT